MANQKALQVIIGLPASGFGKFSSDIMLTVNPRDDFKLSWMDCIKRQNKPLFDKLEPKKDTYTIMDRRPTSIRKVWKLSSQIKDFIDSFGRTLQVYKAFLSTTRANTSQSTPTTPRTPHHQQTSSRAANNSAKKTSFAGRIGSPSVARGQAQRTPTPAKQNSSVPLHQNKSVKVGIGQEINMRITAGSANNGSQTRSNTKTFHNVLNIPVDVDDSASMASTVDSQNSQLEELEKEGVANEEIKGEIIQKIVKHVDNSAMLRMRHELKKLVRDGKFLRVMRHIPNTASTLQLIFLQVNE